MATVSVRGEGDIWLFTLLRKLILLISQDEKKVSFKLKDQPNR